MNRSGVYFSMPPLLSLSALYSAFDVYQLLKFYVLLVFYCFGGGGRGLVRRFIFGSHFWYLVLPLCFEAWFYRWTKLTYPIDLAFENSSDA